MTVDIEGVASGQLCECPRVAQPAQNLNPIEHLWRDLKKAVQRRSPSNLIELERFCKEEWAKLTKDRRAKLVASYYKRLEAVIAAKMQQQSIEQRL